MPATTPSATRPASEPPARPPALSLNAWLRWDVVRRLLAPLPDGAAVLEVGCGRGAVAARLARRFDYTGYEPDPASHARAAAAVAGRGRVVRGVLPAEPDRSYDLVCALEVVEHIEDDAAALARWARWLRPGGLMVLSAPARPHRFGEADRAVGHFRRYDRDGLAALLRDAGLDDVAVLTYGFPLGHALELAREALARLRPPAGTRAERTAASGRWLPPPDALGTATRLATWPFRLAQRPFARSGPGTGLVATARRPG